MQHPPEITSSLCTDPSTPPSDTASPAAPAASRLGRRASLGAMAGLLLCAGLSSGCSASSKYMVPAAAPTGGAPADKALVYFMRPSNFGGAIRMGLFDGEKKFLGHALPESYWTLEMDPGEHWIYGYAENLTVLKADLEAGKSYYVVARPRMGVWKTRISLTALAERTEDWDKRQAWLDDSEYLSVDTVGGQAELDDNADDIASKIEKGQELWAKWSEEERDLHSLKPADGI